MPPEPRPPAPALHPLAAVDTSAAAAAAQRTAEQQALAKQVQEHRRKFLGHLDDHILDYFHNNPIHIEACLNTCIKVFGNVVHNPHEDKFRKVKATSNLLKNTVLTTNVRGGDQLLPLAGWATKVVEMEKFYLFDAPEGSWRFELLKEAHHLCEKALGTVHEKAEKRRKEHEDKLGREAAERERIRLAIEEDKAERRLRSELTAAVGPAVSPGLAGGRGGGQGQGQGHGVGEEEEDSPSPGTSPRGGRQGPGARASSPE